MSETRERTIERLEKQLEAAEETLSSLRPLDEKQAHRVAQRMDRLHSQLLAVSEPPSLQAAHEDMGIKPVGAENFDALADEMRSSDREG